MHASFADHPARRFRQVILRVRDGRGDTLSAKFAMLAHPESRRTFVGQRKRHDSLVLKDHMDEYRSFPKGSAATTATGEKLLRYKK